MDSRAVGTLLLIAVVVVSASSPTTLSVIKSVQNRPIIVTGYASNAIVTSAYNNTYNETGWSTLEIHGIPGNTDEDIAYYAGYIEGNQTGHLIYMTYMNSINSGDIMCSDNTNTVFCQRVSSFVEANLQYMSEQIKNNPGSDYWNMVHLYLKQLSGLADGYHSNKNLPPLSKNAFLYLQINNDLSNLQDAFNTGSSPTKFNINIGDGKCSAFIKLLRDNEDLLTTHDTWSEYQSMLRIYKLYHLPYKTQSNIIPGSAISMSSYPGKLQSEDDYYIINTGLVTMETTNGNNNRNLWSDLSSSSVFEPIRVMVSNRLAMTGKQWTETFARCNSGTYNNQWMIVDYNLFKPNTKLPSANVLWILEQLPGYIIFGDETRTLIDQSYWASYNIPYYSSIYKASDMSVLADKYGDWFTHSGAPRAKIFARNHTHVVDMKTLIRLMRYNDFKHDPLSVCNCTPPYSGENAISARSDLNPSTGVYPFSALGHRLHGGTDNKATNYQMVSQLSALVTCGPTHDQQPVFKWSQTRYTRPLGHPDTFDFDTIQIQWNG